jgi:RNA polymerase sigma factor for flagellar operon FliA
MATKETIDRLWQDFWHGKADARRELIETYLPLVQRIVARLAINLPPFVDRSDLEGAAVLGLIDALAAFQEERGVKFETYAAARIRGAALDSLRRLDFVPRSVRKKARLLQDSLRLLYASLGRQPEPSEIAQELGITPVELDKWWQEVQSVTILSLDAPLDDAMDSGSYLERLPSADLVDPLDQLLAEERADELAQAIGELSQREQQLLGLYYQEGLTLKELGKVLGITESRACQIHSAAMVKLRARLLPGEGEKGVQQRSS